MLTVDAMTTAGAFTFESVTLMLQNADGDAATPETEVYTTESTSDVVVALTDAGLTINPTNPVTDLSAILANATAVSNTAGVGDKATFTAWVTNSTDGLAQNVTVNYKITGAKNATGSVMLTNQGLNGTSTSTTINLWNGTLTAANDTQAGNLTVVSVVVHLKSTPPSQTRNQTITAADAKATNVVKIDVPAPVDPPAANKTTSNTSATTASANTSASSSVTISDSPVSIFAVFILIASVSVAVGAYTLRRRQ